jgi:hypothetical protein
MKTMAIGLAITLLFGWTLLAQQPPEVRSIGADLLAVLNGNVERFERGMQALEALLAKLGAGLWCVERTKVSSLLAVLTSLVSSRLIQMCLASFNERG